MNTMSLDILMKNASRNWARNAQPASSVSGTSTGGKIALGGMALGTFLGLALITSPWWADQRKPYHHVDWTGKTLPKPRHP
jgi:hypothetical protein